MPRVALDFAVVNPQGARYRDRAAQGGLSAAGEYTQHKRDYQETDRKCIEANVDFQPVVWESFGGVGMEGRELLKSLYRLVALNTNTPLAVVAHRYWHRFSVDMQKANHRAFAKRVGGKTGFGFFEHHSRRFLSHSWAQWALGDQSQRESRA